MRSDHRHELKTNELADWIANLPDWAQKNRNTLTAAGAVILVALLVYFMSFYRSNVVSARNQIRLTGLVTQVPQQMSRVASAAMQNNDESYILVQTEKDLEDFAAKASNSNMAALAWIQRGAALRGELHLRLNEVSRDEAAAQIEKAKASYQQALDRKPSSLALVGAAKYGLGLCEEELGNFDKAGEIYREVAEKPDYAGTDAQAAAAYRLKTMSDYKTAVVFQPAPPKPPQASAPTVGPLAQPVTVAPAPAAPATAAPATPSGETKTNTTAAPAPAPASSPMPAPAPSTSDTNAPKSN